MTSEPARPVVECTGVTQTFSEGALNVEVLRGIDFAVAPAEQVAIVGASGTGKSTLLHILGSLALPAQGSVTIDGENVYALGEKARGELRNRALGFVYQFHHLLPEFTALENVAMPLLIRRQDSHHAMASAQAVLQRVGLGNRLQHKPGELSGGERQRTAIARAMVTRPKCIMADEPTGNLDSKTAASIHGLLLELNQEAGTSLVVVTHDLTLADKIGRSVTLEDGRLQ